MPPKVACALAIPPLGGWPLFMGASGSRSLPGARSFVAIVLAGLFGSNAEGQSPSLIRAPKPCTDCIQLDRTLTLGGSKRIGSPPLIVKRDSRGSTYVVVEDSDVPPLVFAPTGRFERTLGKIGLEAGHTLAPGILEIAARDSVVVADIGQSRLSVFSATGKFHRSADFEVVPGPGFRMKSGEFVFVYYAASPQVAGFPAHVLSATGKYLRSFGEQRAIVPGLVRPHYVGVEGRSGDVWLARRTAYKLEAWSTTGKRIRELQGSATWFPETRVGTPISPDAAPATEVRAVSFDHDANHLWVYISVVDSAWRRGIRLEKGAHGLFYRVFDWDVVFNTRVEVIDATTAQVISTAEFPHVIAYVPRHGEVASLRGQYGNAFIDIWTVRLRESQQRFSPRE